MQKAGAHALTIFFPAFRFLAFHFLHHHFPRHKVLGVLYGAAVQARVREREHTSCGRPAAGAPPRPGAAGNCRHTT